MRSSKILGFLFQSIFVGLLAAALLYAFKPELFQSDSDTLTIRESAGNTTIATPPGLGNGPVSYADAVEMAAPAVVNVYTAKRVQEQTSSLFNDPLFRYFFGDRFQQQRERLQTSLGSGVIISDQGFLLTNNHVVQGAEEIQVMMLDGRSYSAGLVGADPDSDLAVLKIDADDLPSVVVGQSDNLRVGDVVLAIGNPFGVGQTVTLGIVSATGRNSLGISTYENFIQTDAAINPGNSGGALINARGELVGINTAIFSKSGGSQGIGFAIPMSLATGITKQIVEKGTVVRGWLGIEAQDLTPSLAQSFGLETTRGVLIAGVLRNGPADDAGIEPGDVLLAIDGVNVNNARDAMNRIAQQPPGTALAIQAMRQGKPIELEATIAQRPQQ